MLVYNDFVYVNNVLMKTMYILVYSIFMSSSYVRWQFNSTYFQIKSELNSWTVEQLLVAQLLPTRNWFIKVAYSVWLTLGIMAGFRIF